MFDPHFQKHPSIYLGGGFKYCLFQILYRATGYRICVLRCIFVPSTTLGLVDL